MLNNSAHSTATFKTENANDSEVLETIIVSDFPIGPLTTEQILATLGLFEYGPEPLNLSQSLEEREKKFKPNTIYKGQMIEKTEIREGKGQ